MTSIVSVRVRFVRTNRRGWVNAGLASLGLLCALYGQRAIYSSQQWQDGALFLVAALALIAALVVRDASATALPLNPSVEIPHALSERTSRWILVVPCVLFAALAFLSLGKNEFTVAGTLAWLTSLALFLLTFWEGTPSQWWESIKRRARVWTNLNTTPLRISWTTAAFAVIILVGAFFYFFRLDEVPAEMTSDHAEKIYDTYDILQGKHPIFFERNTGREPLQFYLNATVVALGIAPLDQIALKTVTALMGLLTVPAVYLMVREMFDPETGLLAAFFTAVSIWSVGIARVGLRYPLAPEFVAFSTFFLIRALRRMSRNDFLMAGVMLGIGLNGYSPFRVAVLVAAAFVVLWLFVGKNLRREQLPGYALNVGLMFGAMALVFLPLLRYTTEHPDNFFYRMMTRLTSDEISIPGNPVLILLSNLWNGLLMFNVRGDPVWVNSIPLLPIVDYITGALLLVGVIYGAYRVVRYREYPYLFAFIAIFILLLPSTLAIAFPEENPSVVRAGGAIPFVMMLVAVPLVAWHRQLRVLGSRWLPLVLMGLLLFWVAKINYDLYFIKYDDQYRRASWNTTEIAAAFKAFSLTQGDLKHTYIVVYPYWIDHRAVGIHLGLMQFDDHQVHNAEELRSQVKDPAAKFYALKKEDQASIELLKQLYPNGILKEFKSRTPDRNFMTFYAPTKS